MSSLRPKKPITIVTYHSIGVPLDPYTVSPDAFARQMHFINENYSLLPLGDLFSHVERNGSLHRAVVVTFDDAFLDFFEVAYPILTDHNIPATVFVPTGYIGGYNGWDAGGDTYRRKPLMTEGQLSTLHEGGLISLGSHTVDHVRMAQLPPADMQRQTLDSKSAIEEITGAPVTTFAYPYGQLDDFSSETARVLAEAGYLTAVTSHWGTRNSPEDRLWLRRIALADDDSEAVLRLKLEGWYDWIAAKERVAFGIRQLRSTMRRGPQSGTRGRFTKG